MTGVIDRRGNVRKEDDGYTKGGIHEGYDIGVESYDGNANIGHTASEDVLARRRNGDDVATQPLREMISRRKKRKTRY